MKEHPHDALIHKLEECLDDLRELGSAFELDDDEYASASTSLDNAIDEVRAINI